MSDFMKFAEMAFRRSISEDEYTQGIKCLGIDSLTFWDFIALIEKEFKVELDMDDLIDLDNLKQLEEMVNKERGL